MRRQGRKASPQDTLELSLRSQYRDTGWAKQHAGPEGGSRNQARGTIPDWFILVYYFMYVGILPARTSVHHLHAWHLWRPEEGTRYPETRVTDSCGLLCGCWEWNLGCLEEKNCWELSLVSFSLSFEKWAWLYTPVIPALESLRQYWCGFQANLGYIMGPCLNPQVPQTEW